MQSSRRKNVLRPNFLQTVGLMKSPWLKFYRYVWQWENYLLLARTWRAARLVKRVLKHAHASPLLSETIAAVTPLYLAPQPGWRISTAEKIYLFANLIVGVPHEWGRCAQRALIVYRLLNAYGIPAHFHCGVLRDDHNQPGHAWVCLAAQPHHALGETENPAERFQTVFRSPLPDRGL